MHYEAPIRTKIDIISLVPSPTSAKMADAATITYRKQNETRNNDLRAIVSRKLNKAIRHIIQCHFATRGHQARIIFRWFRKMLVVLVGQMQKERTVGFGRRFA